MNEADDTRPVMVERDTPRPVEPVPTAGASLMLAQYQGPLPPAAEFEKYERTLPGAADRILRMAEEQQRHRFALEERELAAAIADTRRGMWLAFGIGTATIVAGAALAIFAQSTAASVLGVLLSGGGVAGLVTAFIKGRGK